MELGDFSWCLEFLYGSRTQAIVVFTDIFTFFGRTHLASDSLNRLYLDRNLYFWIRNKVRYRCALGRVFYCNNICFNSIEENDFVVKSLAAIFPPEPVLSLGNSSFQVRRLPRLLYRQVIRFHNRIPYLTYIFVLILFSALK